MYNTEYLFSLNFLRIESHASAFTELVNTLYAAVADGVDVADEGGGGLHCTGIISDFQHFTPGIILVLSYNTAGRVENADHVSLNVAHIVVGGAVIQETIPLAVLIKHIGDEIAAFFLRYHGIAIEIVFGCRGSHRLLSTNAGFVVLIGCGDAALGQPRQLPAALPGHGHPVAVGEGVADGRKVSFHRQ